MVLILDGFYADLLSLNLLGCNDIQYQSTFGSGIYQGESNMYVEAAIFFCALVIPFLAFFKFAARDTKSNA